MNLQRVIKNTCMATITATMSTSISLILQAEMSYAFATKLHPSTAWSHIFTRSSSTRTAKASYRGLALDNTKSDCVSPFRSRNKWRGETALFSSRNFGRGLATQVEGATPKEGGMILYLKAGPDGESVGDCPFAHFVRMVLNEKKLPYTTRPCVQQTKPAWLVDYYEGKMPALRHRSECYTESDVIAEYLEFFFEDPPLSPPLSQKEQFAEAKDLAGSVFPSIAKYLKSTKDGEEEDLLLKDNLFASLAQLEDRLTAEGRTGSFLSGDGELMTLADCSLAPKLFHMQVGLKYFKQNAIDVETDFPALATYMKTMFARESFQDSLYPEETVVWGWSNARS